MHSMVSKALEWARQLGYLALEYGNITVHWMLRLSKVQLQKLRKCGVMKKLDKAYGKLGSEVYALHKQNETDWARMPSVEQQVRFTEEAEAGLFQIEEAIERINNEYHARKEEIKEKYAAKRAQAREPKSPPEE